MLTIFILLMNLLVNLHSAQAILPMNQYQTTFRIDIAHQSAPQYGPTVYAV